MNKLTVLKLLLVILSISLLNPAHMHAASCQSAGGIIGECKPSCTSQEVPISSSSCPEDKPRCCILLAAAGNDCARDYGGTCVTAGTCAAGRSHGESGCNSGQECCVIINQTYIPETSCTEPNAVFVAILDRCVQVEEYASLGMTLLIIAGVLAAAARTAISFLGFLTAQGDPQKMQIAREGLNEAIVGAAIVVSGWVFLELFQSLTPSNWQIFITGG